LWNHHFDSWLLNIVIILHQARQLYNPPMGFLILYSLVGLSLGKGALVVHLKFLCKFRHLFREKNITILLHHIHL
jgi:hypothetical protein